MSWQGKAHRIIGELSRQSWHAANHSASGRKYKKHRPYSIPVDAQLLVEALGKNDEETAKAIFMRRLMESV